MKGLLQRAFNEPLWIIASLWPLALLAPLVPGLPRPLTSKFFWRQELALALLLCVALTLLARRAYKTGAWAATLRRSEFFTLFPLLLFFLWSAASLLWSAGVYPALHHTFDWGTYLLFFFMMSRAAKHPRLLRASIKTLAIVISIISISCIIEFWGASALLIRDSTGLGEPLAVALPIFAVLALRLRRARAAIFCGATAVLAWLAMLQSLERATAIGASVALLVLVAASFIKRRWRPRSLQRAVILLLLFGAAAALQTLPSPATQDRPSAFTRLQTNTSADDLNLRVRFLWWTVGLEMLRERPLTGVGAGNYDRAFPEARGQFSARYPDSGLVALSEDFIAERAHNEYIQILAELGAVGFTFFILFCVALMIVAWRALRYAKSPLALGGVCSLVAFALSSGASSMSFRWMGSGLMFFFAAALVTHFSANRQQTEKSFKLTPIFMRTATVTALVVSFLIFFGRGAQATNSVLQGMATTASSADRTEQLYQQALAWNPFDAPTHFNLGMWLYLNGRAGDAVPHLRFAVEQGFNESSCYSNLAAAEAVAGDLSAAEKTLAYAVYVYPRSVFLRTRYAHALAEAGNIPEAEREYAAAVGMNERQARGWQQLINFGIDAASEAARRNSGIAFPGELAPENGLRSVISENKLRQRTVALLGDAKLSGPGSIALEIPSAINKDRQ